MTDIRDVNDWATDWDHHHPDWVNDPFPIWDELREQCPVAHTGRYNEGVWLPTRYEDVTAIARDTETFSSGHDGATAGGTVPRGKFPPIHLDPPEHLDVRRVLLPFFAPHRMQEWEPGIRAHCESLAASLATQDEVCIAQDYAAHIPASGIATLLGIPASVGEKFRQWMHWFELGDNNTELRDRSLREMAAYFGEAIEARRSDPGDDLISHLVTAEIDGERFDDATLQRILVLQLVAGIDTTWGVLGASLWHLATHLDDRRRLVAEPELIPTAIEEFLRAYASVSLYRRVTREATIGDTEVQPGDTVLMAFPAACRDPEAFESCGRGDHRPTGEPTRGLRCRDPSLPRLEPGAAGTQDRDRDVARARP